MSGDVIRTRQKWAIVALSEQGYHWDESASQFRNVQHLRSALDCPLVFVDRQDECHAVALKQSLDHLQREHPNRCSLIIVGSYLEGAITQAALACLREGYSAFVCADLTACRDSTRETIYFERLRRSGAVVTTAEQCLREALFHEPGMTVREAIQTSLRTLLE